MDWLDEALRKVEKMPQKVKEVRERALVDLNYFAHLVNPGYMYGAIHREIFTWMQDYTLFGQGDMSSNKLIMLPRGHLKSHMVATWTAWIITRHPEVTILYLSATAELAETQLYAIKNILSSDVYTQIFPEYLNPQEGLREKWSVKKMTIDHPKRVKEAPRDPTVATAGLTTNTTGWHADIIVADDLVVPENAYTEDGRESVVKKASQFTSIRNAGGFTMACGTRYHPNDIYSVWKEQVYDVYDDEGTLIDKKLVWEVKEFAVEENGIYIWPRMIRASDHKAFGFNQNVLSRIRGEYSDIVQFYAQYYNNPNDPSSDRISRDKFQYYDVRNLKKEGQRWFMKGKRLNIYAAVDFAFSLSKGADWTAIVVVGVDSDSNYYVLDIERFKTNKTIEYFQKIKELHAKWKFNKLQAEISVAQQVIVESIKDYIRQDGLTLSIIEFRPSSKEGSKEERIAAVLEPKYDNLQVWHFEGGWIDTLEQELVQARPAHDDIKDALASAVSIAVRPAANNMDKMKDFFKTSGPVSRFGGVPFK
jgi:predicted phage terminase large subunit-like protein